MPVFLFVSAHAAMRKNIRLTGVARNFDLRGAQNRKILWRYFDYVFR